MSSDRLDLELYADRLARHAARLADELATARLRVSWSEHEAVARAELGEDAWAALEAIGVVEHGSPNGPLQPTDVALIERRREQLQALAQLQVITEQRIAAL